MRFIRLMFIIALAVLLIGIALANRSMVTVHAFPAGFDQYLGLDWQLTMPLFLVIFLAIMFGIMAGFIWEWLRESHLRSESSRRKNEVAKLEREVGKLRDQHNAPADDVLAILDKPKPAGNASAGQGTSLPAPR